VIHLEEGLYVRVVELANGPAPRPLQSGFRSDLAYRVLGLHSASETSECYLILSNDRDEIWFISNRHLRTCAVQPEPRTLRCDLEQFALATAA